MDLQRIETISSRINAIDGLRAVAIIAVFVYHLQASALPGGYTGVDVFFVISGFVVCRSLLKTLDTPFIPYISSFLSRRILRIYPPLLVMLIVTAGLFRAFVPPGGLGYPSYATGFYAVFGLSNFNLAKSEDDYFGKSFDFNPFIHTWSLGVEEQFYLIFPFVVFIALRFDRFRVGLGRKVGLSLLSGLCFISLIVSIYWTSKDSTYAFYMLPSRFWELGLGAVLSLSFNDKRKAAESDISFFSVGTVNVLGCLGFLCIGFGFLKESTDSFSVQAVWFPVIGSVLYIAAIVRSDGNAYVARLLSNRPMVWIGKLSYSLYLWHWPVIVIQRWTIGLDGPLRVSVAIAITILLATTSYYVVEGISRRIHHLLDNEIRIQVGRKAERQFVPFTSAEILASWVVLSFGFVALMTAGMVYKRIQHSKRLPQSVVAIDTWDNPWIIKSPGIIPERLNPGENGRVWSSRKLFVIGDSHVEAYAELFSMLRRDRGVSVYPVGYGGLRVGSLVRRQTSADLAKQDEFLNVLKTLATNGDIVFLPGLRVQRFCNQDYAISASEIQLYGPGTEMEEERLVAVEEGAKLIEAIEELGLEVIIEAPKPVFRTPFFRVADKFNRMNPIGEGGTTLDRDFLLAHRAAAMKSLEEIVRRFANTQIWDPFPILCPEEECCAFDGELPLFFDGDHLSSYGNRKLYPDFVLALERVWGDGCE
jgi:peptidoglycan/LPS O-acetylase OafA/YrhL